MRLPAAASATARLAETVDLPTPPLPEAMAMTRSTPGMRLSAGSAGLRRPPMPRSGGGPLGVERREGVGSAECAVSRALTRVDARQRLDGRLRGGAQRLGLLAERRVDLDDEVDAALVADGDGLGHVGGDDVAARAGVDDLSRARRGRRRGWASFGLADLDLALDGVRRGRAPRPSARPWRAAGRRGSARARPPRSPAARSRRPA